MRRIYFDNAATTPMSEAVIEAMTGVMRDQFGNPSSIHAEGRSVRSIIESARKTVAKHLNASIGEIFFTSGGTEANNMAIKCAVRDLGVSRIITSPLEHHCVLHSLEALQREKNIVVEFVRVDHQGLVDYTHLEVLLNKNDHKTLVSLMHANNEIGTLLDLERVSALCKTYGAYFHSDTVQTIGHFPIDLNQLGIHFLSCGAHKFHGPKGAGFIYINREAMLKPLLDGGAQERNMRGGTENVYGIVGLAKALDLAMAHLEERKQYILMLRHYLKEQLEKYFEGIRYNGSVEVDDLYTILSVSFPPSPKSGLLLLSLDIAGISASGGSACSSGADTGSHVISALGHDPARKTIRFSFSHYNKKEEIDYLVAQLKALFPANLKKKIMAG